MKIIPVIDFGLFNPLTVAYYCGTTNGTFRKREVMPVYIGIRLHNPHSDLISSFALDAASYTSGKVHPGEHADS